MADLKKKYRALKEAHVIALKEIEQLKQRILNITSLSVLPPKRGEDAPKEAVAEKAVTKKAVAKKATVKKAASRRATS